MSDTIIAHCPSCSQKYRVPKSNVGSRARCRKCGQTFKLLEEPPIDDETIFGWVTEDDASSSSILGGTGLFGHTFHEPTHVPANNGWVHPPPPERPRVVLQSVDEDGACFVFSPSQLSNRDFLVSFPHRCVQCLGRDDLELHYVVWTDKAIAIDAAMISETETRTHRSLNQLMAEHGLKWFKALEPIGTFKPPFNAPLVYCICPQCSVPGAVRGRVKQEDFTEKCQLIISHPSIALEFYRNNGGRNTPGYKRLLVFSRQRRDNQWKSLAIGIRTKIGKWYTPVEGEKFLGYYADRDFDQTDRGTAGVVLTDQRLIYKKYAALREYLLDKDGLLDIEATQARASIEIQQKEERPATLATTPLAASSLARTLSGLKKPWKINVVTHR